MVEGFVVGRKNEETVPILPFFNAGDFMVLCAVNMVQLRSIGNLFFFPICFKAVLGLGIHLEKKRKSS